MANSKISVKSIQGRLHNGNKCSAHVYSNQKFSVLIPCPNNTFYELVSRTQTCRFQNKREKSKTFVISISYQKEFLTDESLVIERLSKFKISNKKVNPKLRNHAAKKYWQKRNSTQVFTSSGILSIFYFCCCDHCDKMENMKSEFDISCLCFRILNYEEQLHDSIFVRNYAKVEHLFSNFHFSCKYQVQPKKETIGCQEAMETLCIGNEHSSYINKNKVLEHESLCSNYFKTMLHQQPMNNQSFLLVLVLYCPPSALSIFTLSFTKNNDQSCQQNNALPHFKRNESATEKSTDDEESAVQSFENHIEETVSSLKLLSPPSGGTPNAAI